MIDELNADPACTGFLVQQPTGLDEFALLSRVDPDKDVDGLHPVNLGKLVLGEPGSLPCTPIGCIELLRRHGVEIAGAEVVVRRPRPHRRPAAGPAADPRSPRTPRSRSATPAPATWPRTPAPPTSSSPPPACPGIITGDMVKPGAAVLDVGVSRVDGKIAGDVAADVWDVAGWVSPNPGGVGPMTRAMLLSNIVLGGRAARCRERPTSRPPSRRPRRRSPRSSTRREEHGDEEERRYPSTIGGAFYLRGAGGGRRSAIGDRLRPATGGSGIRWLGGALLLRGAGPGWCCRPGTPACSPYATAGSTLPAARRLGVALIFLAGSIPDQPGL